MPVELNHIDTGGEGVPLVVVHGLLGSADNWRSHIKKWRDSRRVIAVDLRNHGRSPHVEGMGYEAMAEDLMALLDRLDVQKAHLLGHSMGGKVVISVARLAPSRVASLIVADIAPQAYGHDHDAIFAGLRHLESGRRRPAARPMPCLPSMSMSAPLGCFWPPTWSVASKVGYAANRPRRDRGRLRRHHGSAGRRGAFEGPTLVVRGSRSQYVTDEMLPALRRVLPMPNW
ncbi:esterase YbfF [Halomonas elongata]|uniref:Esterase YbfF n=1 Tax=Halomonas elongata TaxID=2746 RepID=A0A1B8P229_HALEL|nr:alpha/beta fold hydrolase [Halomonas elongata]OBX36307.1 esterase YbfF [Halomonas elongata]